MDLVRQGRGVKRPHMAYMGGWLGFDNLGDEAIFDAAEILFPQCGMIPYSGRDGFEIALTAKLFNSFNPFEAHTAEAVRQHKGTVIGRRNVKVI